MIAADFIDAIDDQTMIAALRQRGYLVFDNDRVKILQWSQIVHNYEYKRVAPEFALDHFKEQAVEKLTQPLLTEAITYSVQDDYMEGGKLLRATVRFIK